MKRLVAAIVVVTAVGMGPVLVEANTAVARWVVNAVLEGLTYEAIMATLMRDYSMTEDDAATALSEGLTLMEQIRTDPNPSLADCMWDAYQWLNPNCSDVPSY